MVEINKGPGSIIPSTMKKYSYLIFAAGLLLLACNESQTCESVHDDLLSRNVAGVKEGLNPWLSKWDPDATEDDPTGHQQNLQSFINRLEKKCSFQADLICYACIETNPSQSEVKIVLDSVGHQVERVLDILTPEDDVMVIWNIHP